VFHLHAVEHNSTTNSLIFHVAGPQLGCFRLPNSQTSAAAEAACRFLMDKMRNPRQQQRQQHSVKEAPFVWSVASMVKPSLTRDSQLMGNWFAGETEDSMPSFLNKAPHGPGSTGAEGTSYPGPARLTISHLAKQ